MIEKDRINKFRINIYVCYEEKKQS
jgi:hypothetical protein